MPPEDQIIDPSVQADGSIVAAAEPAAPIASVATVAADNSITLSDGRVAVCREAIGKDQVDARKLIDGNVDRFYFALFEICVTVNGEKLFVSDYENMRLKDVTAITVLFDSINF